MYLISSERLNFIERVPDESTSLRPLAFRVQALLNLRRSGAVTIQAFAARLKEFSTDELIDLSAGILKLSELAA